MEAGSGMLYPTQAVDGVVHRLGGAALRQALADAAPELGGVRCDVGAAVITPAVGALTEFDLIAHTPPPFWPGIASQHAEWATQLGGCYVASAAALRRATATDAPLRIAVPLLGAGAAGAPVAAAARAAAAAVPCALLAASLAEHESGLPRASVPPAERAAVTIRFVFQDQGAREAMREAIAKQRQEHFAAAAWEHISVHAADVVGRECCGL
jgi:O-acetyl-ADP-ribose deacetylase (regulator of RNase III)